ncbi:MAG: DNA-binding winged helix-turn-helix (wHTH) protein [Phenylobacterium sp.]|jgi:DNA-binding winged helix-turn-helix (wHTH) protein
MPDKTVEKVKLNTVEVDFLSLKLLIDGNWQNIEARQLSLLKLLLDNHGNPVSRNQIMNVLWPDTIVSDNSVSQAVTQLRKSLQDIQGTPQFIRTVPKVGYQLIADVTYPEPPADNAQNPVQTTSPLTHKSKITIAISSAVVATLLTFGVIELAKPSIDVPRYQYESRLTSVPGPESFLRYSPDGRYLAFSQTAENRAQMDLVVYDSQTESIHSIKSTGYSEQAPEWSPDGRWLIYYRHDPISCDIRIMSVANPVETWRLSPDFHLGECAVGYSRQKMHWIASDTLYISTWQDNEPVLSKISLSTPTLDKRQPTVQDIKHYPKYHPVLMDIDKTSQQVLMVEKQQPAGYQLRLLNLTNFSTRIIQSNQRDYWGLKWDFVNKNGNDNSTFWLGNDSLRLMSLGGDSEIVHLPMGFIPDIDLNPVTRQLAHAEGLININLYTLNLNSLTEQPQLRSRQLSSSARTDILPAISPDGRQTAFVSYQRRSMDGLKHVEIWLKHKHKKAASLLANLDESIVPNYLLWSANGENILLGDSLQNVYLINTFSKHMVPIVSGFDSVDAVNWSTDGKQITFKALTGGNWQRWQYDLQLATTALVKEIPTTSPTLMAEQIHRINPSYLSYHQIVEQFLTDSLQDNLPVEYLQPSLALYRPAVVEAGIYYIARQGHQLLLFLYRFDTQENVFITEVGQHEQDINVPLNISASQDGRQVVFSKVEGIETDILVQRRVGGL